MPIFLFIYILPTIQFCFNLKLITFHYSWDISVVYVMVISLLIWNSVLKRVIILSLLAILLSLIVCAVSFSTLFFPFAFPIYLFIATIFVFLLAFIPFLLLSSHLCYSSSKADFLSYLSSFFPQLNFLSLFFFNSPLAFEILPTASLRSLHFWSWLTRLNISLL